MTVDRQPHWTGPAQAYIGELAVAESAEGSGAGRALIAAAETWARGHGCTMLALDTGVANTRARAFYDHLGFAEESIRLVRLIPPDTGTTAS